MNRAFLDRLAVCSWSLQPSSPDELIQRLREIGISGVQIALDPIREQPALWGDFEPRAREAGLRLVSGMIGCVGEDYSTMETIRRTGGIVPDTTWIENSRNVQAAAEIAARMGLKLVTFHAGFLPHDSKDPEYAKLLERLRQVAGSFARHNLDLALETGQEDAETLSRFLKELQCANVGVNFDPANMILYDRGDPIEALQVLGPWLKQCHIKDARKTKVPGTWGEEVVAGTGEVPWRKFFQVLDEQGFQGHCAIEREAGNQRVQDIKAARQMVERLFL